MARESLVITDRDRLALTKIAASRRTPRGQSTRARIVLACAEGTVAEAARSCGVSFRTAAKWRQRFELDGVEGLVDAPRKGRPATADDAVRRVLTCALAVPPSGRWTTRSIADFTGLSQSTVCRIRNDRILVSERNVGLKVVEQSAILAFVHIDPGRRMLAVHSPPTVPERHPRRPSTAREIADAIETVLCAGITSNAHLMDTADIGRDSTTTLSLLRRATADIAPERAVTVAVDFELDSRAKYWLRNNPHVEAVVVPSEHWLGQLRALTEGVDARQLPELLDLQSRIRAWHQRPTDGFEWSRTARSFESEAARDIGTLHANARQSDAAIVVRGLCAAIADGTLYAGRRVSERAIAARVPLSSGAVSDALRQLAEDGLVNQDGAGSYFVPAPNERDVVETYTARGLLGTAIVRRLASRANPLPGTVDDVFDALTRSAREKDIAAADSLDLDLQDELARAAETPRIEAMFIRLTMQLRLFVTLMALNYQYPVDGIVDDDSALLAAIRSRDSDAAVEAWRSKIDNCVRYMMQHLEQRPRR